MPRLFAQGDLVIELVKDQAPSGSIIPPIAGAYVLAEGEMTGHKHAIHDQVTFFRDDALARDIPNGLYIGHVRVERDAVALEHNEHAPIMLPRGTYRVRRQRQLEPRDVRLVSD